MEFAVSNRIYELMKQRGLTKQQFAQALGKKPSEVTKWLSGQHNFTLKTISMLSTFFGQPLIHIYDNAKSQDSAMFGKGVGIIMDKPTPCLP